MTYCRWSDGKKYDYKNFKEPEQPKEPDNFRCVQNYRNRFSLNPPEWKTLNCGSHRPYICKVKKGEKPTPKPTTNPTPLKGYCPKSWIGSSEKCFRIVFLDENNGLSWNEAQNKCRTLNPASDLATINSFEENLLITSKMINTDLNNGIWFGLHEPIGTGNAEWVWSDNSPRRTDDDYGNWYDGEPTLYKYYAYLSTFGPDDSSLKEGMWQTSSGRSDKKGYVCSMKKTQSDLLSTPIVKTKCEKGKFLGDGCYNMQNKVHTWAQALNSCKNQKMNLASIHSEMLNAALTFHIVHSDKYYWIGMNSVNSNGTFLWSDGSVVVYTKWEETPENKEKCVAISSTGKWKSLSCNEKLPSICKTPYGLMLTTPSYVNGLCPDPNQGTWIGRGSYCYLFSERNWEARSFLEAKQRCVRLGSRHASLMSVHDITEQAWLTETIKAKYSRDESLWLGIHRRSPNHPYKWSDYTPLSYENWADNHPTSENCAVLKVEKDKRITGFWESTPCKSRSKIKYACKVRKLLYPTTPVPVKGRCPQKPSNEDVWEIFGDKCLLFGKSHMVDYKEALRDCTRAGATLAEIESFEENYFIKQYAEKHIPSFQEGVWIGMRRRNRSGYIWESGKLPAFEFWYHNDRKKRDCVTLNLTKHGYWTSQSCTGRYFPYVCQTQLLLDPTQKPTVSLSTASKIGLGIGITIALGLVVSVFAAIIYKWKSYRETPYQARTNSFASTNEITLENKKQYDA
ncbi:DgyrCDS13848 [Dimorphilus gyrociliatus]|uniref:DgyrCDS13848 n=1 Tax=Dimorphilus gyrociliatus TaxID=2664684 RepID=A0A7I8WBV1_9ANNE|nr:DgyrCDS13848 [Dimorphilus gyrociliatus]